MQTQTVLTVEDDAAIRRGIVDSLRFAGYGVFEAARGDLGREMALARSYDLLLLDLVLPGCEGLDILRAVREVRPAQPVIILTARGEEQDRVEGLRLGADDYVVKPFSVKELLAHVEAVLRRSPERRASNRRSNLIMESSIWHALKFDFPMASGANFRIKKRNFCGTSPRTPGGQSPERNCYAACGSLILVACPLERSTCILRACGKNSRQLGISGNPAYGPW